MSRLMTVVVIALLGATLLSWLATVATTATLNQSDNAGNGLSYSFAMIGVVVTWVLLAVLLLLAFRQQRSPSWVPLAAAIALLLSAASAITVVNLLKGNSDFPAQWPIATIVITPLLVMVFAVWACWSGTPQRMSSNMTQAVLWTVIAAVALIPFPLRSAQKTRQEKQIADFRNESAQKTADEQQSWNSALAALTDSTPLREYLAFSSNGSGLRDQALARARTLPRRQSDIVEMLNAQEGIAMGELRNLDISFTPELCASATEFLRLHAVNGRGKVTYNNNRFIVAAQELDKYIFGMQWLADRSCAMTAALAAYKETALEYPDSPERVEFLKRLEHFAAVAHEAR